MQEKKEGKVLVVMFSRFVIGYKEWEVYLVNDWSQDGPLDNTLFLTIWLVKSLNFEEGEYYSSMWHRSIIEKQKTWT